MNIYIFIIFIMMLLCSILVLIVVLSARNKIKQLNLHISLNHGIQIESIFYK